MRHSSHSVQGCWRPKEGGVGRSAGNTATEATAAAAMLAVSCMWSPSRSPGRLPGWRRRRRKAEGRRAPRQRRWQGGSRLGHRGSDRTLHSSCLAPAVIPAQPALPPVSVAAMALRSHWRCRHWSSLGMGPVGESLCQRSHGLVRGGGFSLLSRNHKGQRLAAHWVRQGETRLHVCARV